MNSFPSCLRLPLALACIALVAGCAAESEASLIAGARSHLQKRDTASAVIQMKTLLQKQPQSGEGRFLLGRALLEGGEARAAVVELQKARQLKHADAEVLPVLARALLAAGQPKAVTDGMAEIRLADAAAQARVMSSVAMAWVLQGRIDRADAALTAALQADPKNIDAQLMQARRVVAKGPPGAALALVDKALTEQPAYVPALLLKAELLLVGGRAVDAIALLKQVLATEPANLAGHALLIQSYLNQNDAAAFKAQVAQLASAAPNSFETLFYRTQLALLENDLPRAREGVQQLLKQAPEHGPVLSLAGTVELQTNELELANKHLTQAMAAMPDTAAPRRTLAQAQLRGGQSERALGTLAPLLTGSKPDPLALALAAEAHLVGGDLRRAESYFQQAADSDPSDSKPRVALALTRISRGDAAGGLQQLRELTAEDKSAYADLALISALAQREDLDAALQAVGSLQAKQPDKPLPYLTRARLLLRQKKTAEARANLERALSIDPLFFAATADLATLEVSQGEVAAALKRVEAYVAKDPRNFDALLGLIEIRRLAGAKPAEVEAALLAAVRQHPTEAAVRVALIKHQLDHRQAQAALTSAQDAIAALPNDPRLIDALAAAQFASGDIQQAIGSFRKVIALQPNQPQPHLRLADLYGNIKDYSAAAQSLNNALEVAPSLLQAQRLLIDLALKRKKPDEALKIARTVQKQRPQEGVGWLLEADVHLIQRAVAPAADALRAALDREPRTDTARRLHALFVLSAMPVEAERVAAAWQAKRPDDADFVFHLGTMANLRGDFAAAESHYRRVLTMLPDSAAATNNVAMMLLKQNKPGALALATKAAAAAPDDAAVMDTMASALAADKQMGPALEWQRKAVARQPAEPDYRLNLARLLIANGDKQQARAELDKLAALGGRFAGNAEVAALVRSL